MNIEGLVSVHLKEIKRDELGITGYLESGDQVENPIEELKVRCGVSDMTRTSCSHNREQLNEKTNFNHKSKYDILKFVEETTPHLSIELFM